MIVHNLTKQTSIDGVPGMFYYFVKRVASYFVTYYYSIPGTYGAFDGTFKRINVNLPSIHAVRGKHWVEMFINSWEHYWLIRTNTHKLHDTSY